MCQYESIVCVKSNRLTVHTDNPFSCLKMCSVAFCKIGLNSCVVQILKIFPLRIWCLGILLRFHAMAVSCSAMLCCSAETASSTKACSQVSVSCLSWQTAKSSFNPLSAHALSQTQGCSTGMSFCDSERVALLCMLMFVCTFSMHLSNTNGR